MMKTLSLDEARGLRQELEAVEATMHRIRGLWLSQDFPTAGGVGELGEEVEHVQGGMEAVCELAGELPTEADLDDLSHQVADIAADLEAIRSHREDDEDEDCGGFVPAIRLVAADGRDQYVPWHFWQRLLNALLPASVSAEAARGFADRLRGLPRQGRGSLEVPPGWLDRLTEFVGACGGLTVEAVLVHAHCLGAACYGCGEGE
jgi:hypothetical protein